MITRPTLLFMATPISNIDAPQFFPKISSFLFSWRVNHLSDSCRFLCCALRLPTSARFELRACVRIFMVTFDLFHASGSKWARLTPSSSLSLSSRRTATDNRSGQPNSLFVQFSEFFYILNYSVLPKNKNTQTHETCCYAHTHTPFTF
jgi:hypothetical protein